MSFSRHFWIIMVLPCIGRTILVLQRRIFSSQWQGTTILGLPNTRKNHFGSSHSMEEPFWFFPSRGRTNLVLSTPCKNHFGSSHPMEEPFWFFPGRIISDSSQLLGRTILVLPDPGKNHFGSSRPWEESFLILPNYWEEPLWKNHFWFFHIIEKNHLCCSFLREKS